MMQHSKISRYIFIIAGMFFLLSFYGPATAKAPDATEHSEAYHVKVNGEPVFVYDSQVASYATFDMNGEAEVVIEANRDVKWVDVRPLSEDIEPEFQDSTIRFTLKEPANLSIELNGEILNRPLFLFANPPVKNVPDPDDPDVIYFEGGKVHKPGLIEMESGQTLYAEAGAVIKGIVHAEDAKDITIRGRGVFDGSNNGQLGRKHGYRFFTFEQCEDVNVEGVILVDSEMWQIVPIACSKVNISNVKIFSNDGGDDGIDLVRCNNVHVDRCFIRTKDDCIAIKAKQIIDYEGKEGSRDITITDCVIWNAAWGNGLEIGFELQAETIENVLYRNIDVIHVQDGAVFSIHNGDYATVKNVRYENIRVEDARQKLFDLAVFLSQYSLDRPKSEEKRRERYLHGAWDGVLSVNRQKKNYDPDNRGHIKNIYFKDISVVDGLFPFSLLYGFNENHRVEDVVFENLRVHGRKINSAKEGKFNLINTRNIRFQ